MPDQTNQTAFGLPDPEPKTTTGIPVVEEAKISSLDAQKPEAAKTAETAKETQQKKEPDTATPGKTSFPFIGLGEEGPPPIIPPVVTPPPAKKFGSRKIIATILGLLVLVGGIGTGVILTKQRQEIRNKAAGTSKSGCSDTCSGDPPSCSGNVRGTEQDPNPPACSSVSVSGMPDSMDAWGITNPTYNQTVTCVARDSQKADCTCQVTNGVPYCWLGLESLVKNAASQGHRWAEYVYDKTTNQLKRGGPTTWVLYDDNGSNVSRWGNGTFFGVESVVHCGERNEYREQADLFSPGSWNETGQVIYAEAAGCNAATPTPTPTPSVSAQCTNIQAFDINWIKITDLTKLKAGDKVRFTVAGSSTAGTFDKARFTINGALRSEVTQTRPSSNPIEFYDEYTVPDGTTNFAVKAELHHSTLGWF